MQLTYDYIRQKDTKHIIACGGRYLTTQKLKEAYLSNAIRDPRAVVVKLLHTAITYSTMLRANRSYYLEGTYSNCQKTQNQKIKTLKQQRIIEIITSDFSGVQLLTFDSENIISMRNLAGRAKLRPISIPNSVATRINIQ